MGRTNQIAVLLLFAGLSANASGPEVKKRSTTVEDKTKTTPQTSTNGFFSANDVILRIMRTQSNNDDLRSEKRNCVFCHSGSE